MRNMGMVKLYEIDWRFKSLGKDAPVNTSLMAGCSEREIVQDMFYELTEPVIIVNIREVVQ